jgi:hypothetical protein
LIRLELFQCTDYFFILYSNDEVSLNILLVYRTKLTPKVRSPLAAGPSTNLTGDDEDQSMSPLNQSTNLSSIHHSMSELSQRKNSDASGDNVRLLLKKKSVQKRMSWNTKKPPNLDTMEGNSHLVEKLISEKLKRRVIIYIL